MHKTIVSLLSWISFYSYYNLLCLVKDTDKPEVHEVIEGNDLRVVCNATEGPEIEIYWWKNDTKAPFREEGRYLTFENIHRNATGEYICYSENVTSHTSSLVEVVKVDVLCKISYMCIVLV